MNLKLKSMFGQFSPDMKLFIPMTIMALLLNLMWLTLSSQSKWLPTQTNLLLSLFYKNMIKTLFQQSKPMIAPWMPIITSVFMLMLSINIIGLLPYAFTSTSHMSLTYSIGIPLWMAMKILGFYLAFNNRLSHLVPQGTPAYLMFLMVMMETISLFAQPMALGLRLAANLTAGHLLIYLLSTAMWTLSKSPTIAGITLIMFVFLFILEMGVACIQAYVFTALLNFYLAQNL